jgi:hypothetical protein
MVICNEYIHNYQIQKALSRIASVMVSVLTLSVVGRGSN